jgi:hypothetical protein
VQDWLGSSGRPVRRIIYSWEYNSSCTLWPQYSPFHAISGMVYDYQVHFTAIAVHEVMAVIWHADRLILAHREPGLRGRAATLWCVTAYFEMYSLMCDGHQVSNKL